MFHFEVSPPLWLRRDHEAMQTERLVTGVYDAKWNRNFHLARSIGKTLLPCHFHFSHKSSISGGRIKFAKKDFCLLR